MMTPTLFSLIVPVYRQVDHIEGVVQNFERLLGELPFDYEIIAVVNGTPDGSLEICQRLAKQNARLKVRASTKSGWGRAVRSGLEAAQGDLICYTNSARTSAQELALLVRYATSFPDVVVKANRKIRENWRRRLGSLLFNIECRVLFDLATWDVNGTPKIFPRSFGRLLKLERDDDLIDVEFNMICRWEGYPILEVPIFSVGRHGGKSSMNWRSAFRLYFGAYSMWRRWRKDVGFPAAS